jgi:hypothetical protein
VAYFDPPYKEIKMDFTREDLDKFDQLMRDAYDKPWWRSYIEQVMIRRNDFHAQLADPGTDLTQRQEDRLRGRINECNFTLALDEIAKQHSEKQGRRVVSLVSPNITFEEPDNGRAE